MSADEVNQPMVLRPVAVLRTPFMEKFGVPRQSGLVPEAEGRVVFAPEFADVDNIIHRVCHCYHVKQDQI